MHSSPVSVRKAAYGLAFTIEDLVVVRDWAQRRRLRLAIALDRTLDGAEFEEMLVLSPAHGNRSTLTVWRTEDGVFAQAPHGVPHRFATIPELLSQLRPVRSRRVAWLQRLGLS